MVAFFGSGKNIFLRSMFAVSEMLGGSFTAQETENVEALKKLINENTTDYYPEPEVEETEEEVEAVEEDAE